MPTDGLPVSLWMRAQEDSFSTLGAVRDPVIHPTGLVIQMVKQAWGQLVALSSSLGL